LPDTAIASYAPTRELKKISQRIFAVALCDTRRYSPEKRANCFCNEPTDLRRPTVKACFAERFNRHFGILIATFWPYYYCQLQQPWLRPGGHHHQWPPRQPRHSRAHNSRPITSRRPIPKERFSWSRCHLFLSPGRGALRQCFRTKFGNPQNVLPRQPLQILERCSLGLIG